MKLKRKLNKIKKRQVQLCCLINAAVACERCKRNICQSHIRKTPSGESACADCAKLWNDWYGQFLKAKSIKRTARDLFNSK